MVTIEIEEDIYNKLKSLAEPFIDTPNTVLRRLLSLSQDTTSIKQINNDSTIIKTEKGLSSTLFMSSFLKKKCGEIFYAKSPYRTMFESENYLVYFQNFNKLGTNNLWYRLNKGSLNILRKTSKKALVCFTNPSDNTVFEIPMKDIDKKATQSKWSKEFFEVNIDPANYRWRELDWNIKNYLVDM